MAVMRGGLMVACLAPLSVVVMDTDTERMMADLTEISLDLK